MKQAEGDYWQYDRQLVVLLRISILSNYVKYISATSIKQSIVKDTDSIEVVYCLYMKSIALFRFFRADDVSVATTAVVLAFSTALGASGGGLSAHIPTSS